MTTSALPSRDVVLFSTADWDHPFWTNKQRVARELAARGFRVLYVESLGLRPPALQSRDLTRIGRRLRRALAPPRQVETNLWVASPLALPWHGRRWVRGINERLLRRWIARQMCRLDFSQPIVWTYNPLLMPIIDGIERSLLVYHCVDDLAAAPHMPSVAIRAGEERLARSADVIFTTSGALHERMRRLQPGATHLLPNVADYDHFAQAREDGPIPADLQCVPRPRIGFVGAVSNYKVDFPLIAATAQARPDWHWVLIGQVGEGQSDAQVDALRLPNVHLLGPRPYAELPNYLRGFDVATIPAAKNDYTAAMFPLKFFEYLAAGLPVVASQVPALHEYASACDLVETPGAFVAAINRNLTGERIDLSLCDAIARRHTWSLRTETMLKILEQAASRATDRSPAQTQRQVA